MDKSIKNPETTILTIIGNAQNGRFNHQKCLKQFEKVYKSLDKNEFSRILLKILQRLIPLNSNNECCKLVLEFLGHFVGHIVTIENSPNQGLAHPLLTISVKFLFNLLQDHQNEWLLVNTCCFIDSMFNHIGDDVIVDDTIGNYIENVLLQTLQDAKATVRLQGISALSRLQNPTVERCPVIRGFVKCLRDANHLVRKEVVKRLAPNGFTISKIKEATRDKSGLVRFAAFSHLADIGIRRLKIAHRRFILKSGFSETNSYVKKSFLEYLIPKWLTQLNKSYLKFLEVIKFDADESDIETTEELSNQIMNVFLKTESVESFIEELNLDDSKLIPQDNIRSENVFYWNILVKFLCHEEDYLDRIIPELAVFCDYINSLIEKKYLEGMDEFEILDFHYILYQLFDITEKLDLSEEVGRKALDNLIQKTLLERRLQPRLLNKLIQIAVKLNPNVDSLTQKICHIISDIWQPVTAFEQPSAVDLQEKKFIRARLLVNLKTLEGDLEDVLENKDYIKAQQLSEQIAAKMNELAKFDNVHSEQVPESQARVVKDDQETLCWCLDILISLLQYGRFQTLPQTLQIYRDEFLMPLITKRNIEICWRAFQCLACYCIFDKNLAQKHLITLCAPLLSFGVLPNVHLKMLVASVHVVTDLIRLFGTELFEFEVSNLASKTMNGTRRLYNQEAEEDDSISAIDRQLTVDAFINILLDILDNDEMCEDLRDASITSILTLMLSNFPIDSMVIMRLVLRWYSPTTQEDLQQKIGMVLQAYTNQITNAKEVVAKAIVPTLYNLAEAPETSPLANVDVDNLINFMCVLSDSKEVRGLLHIHSEIARRILHEISCKPTSILLVYFSKVLDHIKVDPNDSPAARELVNNAEMILEKDDLDKTTKKKIQKFLGKLQNQSKKSTLNIVSIHSNEGSTSSVKQSVSEMPRRWSTIIEEDTNDGSTEEDGDVPRKKRRIEVSEGEIDDDRETETAITTPTDIIQRPEDKIPEKKPQDNNETSETKTNLSSVSSSESDVILSSQPITRSKRAATRQDIKHLTINPKKSKRKKILGSSTSKVPFEEGESQRKDSNKDNEKFGKSNRLKKNGTLGTDSCPPGSSISSSSNSSRFSRSFDTESNSCRRSSRIQAAISRSSDSSRSSICSTVFQRTSRKKIESEGKTRQGEKDSSKYREKENLAIAQKNFETSENRALNTRSTTKRKLEDVNELNVNNRKKLYVKLNRYVVEDKNGSKAPHSNESWRPLASKDSKFQARKRYTMSHLQSQLRAKK
ncbi:condensin complex subunit 3-like isoform X2 [Euwallacea similis]|uniref:condensin complex subunit 3-like isoform X2 n=1 Tax=Euwallacea similis TaxID=1736056 RepID=UPI0034504F2A